MKPDELAARIAAAGLNQSTAADKLGVTRRTVVRWLAGETPISAKNAILIRAVLPNK